MKYFSDFSISYWKGILSMVSNLVLPTLSNKVSQS